MGFQYPQTLPNFGCRDGKTSGINVADGQWPVPRFSCLEVHQTLTIDYTMATKYSTCPACHEHTTVPTHTTADRVDL